MTNKEAADILRLMPKQSDAILKAIEVLESENYYKSLVESYGDTINKLTTAISESKQEQRKGHWIHKMWFLECSNCGYTRDRLDNEGYPIPDNFCPNCGAKMVE